MSLRAGTTRRVLLWVSLALIAGSVGATAANALPPDFVDEVAISGLSQPTSVEFASNGKIFVAEKGGRIKVFDSLSDTTPDEFADLSFNVHSFWDRGLLGLAIHPDFPSTPYVYVLYTYDAPIGGVPPTWGDTCPDPPGSTDDGCVVSGRLSRLTASGNQMTGPEVVLIEDWCAQYPSHTIGDLEFGADGALYVSGGDGASFGFVDYGQGGGDPGSPTPENPCGDPPVPVGGDQQPPAAEGGALRSQDLETSGDPVSLDGTIVRIDPVTGAALSDNPLYGDPDSNAERIVAYGLRNPFRIAIKPGTDDIFIGDVGWGIWEEVNRHQNPTSVVRNFGWPCYEGGSGTSLKQGGYDSANLTICENLYSSGSVTAPLFAYDHAEDITGNDSCPPANPPQGTSSSISGLVFYEGGEYPAAYDGALFGSDFSRDCIWVMYPDPSGNPDPSTIEVFQHQASNPVDLEVGPDGDVLYVDINNGTIRRIRYVGGNNPPTAVIDADPTSGIAPLTVDFDGTGSSDPDGDPLSYAWDLDNDGQFDDASGPTAQWTFGSPGNYTSRLRVTDDGGESDTDSVNIQVSNGPPTAVIDTPTPGTTWRVGDTVNFSGHADDPDQGTLPASALDWELLLHHCADDGSCHVHPIQTFDGVASGSFTAPDHEYPSWLELILTATDQYGASDTASLDLQPETVDLTFHTDPQGLEVSYGNETDPAPIFETFIINSVFTVGVESPQDQGGETWEFDSWSDGGAQSHEITTPETPTTYSATFNEQGGGSSGGGGGGGGLSGPPEVLGTTISFSDIVGNAHEENINLIAAADITRGCNPPLNDLYCPDRPVSRAEIAAFLIRALELELTAAARTYLGTFPDVPQGEWYTQHVELLAELGIVGGYPDGTYRPNEYMTRAEMAKIMALAFGSGSVSSPLGIFTDVPSGIWYELAVEQIYADGFTLGCSVDPLSYCPLDLVRRDQMASYLARALGLGEEESS